LASGEGDRLDLHARAAREGRDLDRRACRGTVADVRGVDLVHPLEVPEVGEEDRRLDELVQPAPRLLENRAQVGEDLLGLVLNRPVDLRVAWLQAELSGNEDEATGTDRL
jgi:hypothetical protein